MCSQAKLQANRRNAQRSTGPRTPAGKAQSARNATTHGLFSRSVVLAGESQEEFDQLHADLLHSLNPTTDTQSLLIAQLACAHWKLARLQQAEQLLLDQHYPHHYLPPPACPIGENEPNPPATPDPADDPPPHLLGALSLLRSLHTDPSHLDRLERYQQRLHNQIHRLLKEFRLLTHHQNEPKHQCPHVLHPLPSSDSDQIDQIEPTAEPPMHENGQIEATDPSSLPTAYRLLPTPHQIEATVVPTPPSARPPQAASSQNLQNEATDSSSPPAAYCLLPTPHTSHAVNKLEPPDLRIGPEHRRGGDGQNQQPAHLPAGISRLSGHG